MSNKQEVKVIVLGQVLTLKSEESIEHIQKVATYVNMKMEELHKSDYSKHLNTKYMNIFLALNIADDYMKSRDKIESVNKSNGNHEAAQLDLQNRINELLEEKATLQSELNESKILIGSLNEEIDTLNAVKLTLENEVEQIKSELAEYEDVFNEN